MSERAWAIRVMGPDDLLHTESPLTLELAVNTAHDYNAGVLGAYVDAPEGMPLCWAVPIYVGVSR